MDTLPLHIVDAFTSEPFRGNPAAICLLRGPAPEAWMKALAAEMNLSETAFLHPVEGGFALRWFTPAVEVDLCGHATLASSHILFSEGVVPSATPIAFQTKSGTLTCRRLGDGRIAMDFPATPIKTMMAVPGMDQALGTKVVYTARAGIDILVEVGSAERLPSLRPNLGFVADLPCEGLIVTAQGGEGTDFVSRYFAPRVGIPEDPATGAAHCALAVHWARRLEKTEFHAKQVSRRVGVLDVTLRGERVDLAGHAVTVLRGEIAAPPAA